jgi:hypothetical protein
LKFLARKHPSFSAGGGVFVGDKSHESRRYQTGCRQSGRLESGSHTIFSLFLGFNG